MCKKSLIVLLFVAVSSFVVSCIDKNYDLANKEIATDVKIEGNSIAVPVGSLKSVVLDSLIDVSGIEMLEKGADGVYCITMDSTISVEESIEPITLNIDSIDYSIPVDFQKANIKNVSIDPVGVTSTITSREISLEELNEKLPKLYSEVENQAFDIPYLDIALSQLAQSGGSYSLSINKPVTVETGEQKVDCEFSYTLPAEIDSIKNITLGSMEDSNGTLVNVVVTNPKPLDGCTKVLNFTIDFPENFKVAKNEAAEQAWRYSVVDEHSIVLEGFEPQGESSVLSFYLTEITDVGQFIVDEGDKRVLRIDESIKYSIDYTVSGTVELNAGVKASDFAFDVVLDVKLAFSDVAGSTKDINVDFQPIAMDFKGEFDDLKYIDTINYVVFNEESRINFTTTMDGQWLEAFRLEEGYALKISFPEELDINNDASTYDSKGDSVVYDADLHAFYVKDMSVLVDSEWELVLQKLTLNDPVVNGEYLLDFSAEIGLVKLNEQGQYEPTTSFVLAGQEIKSFVNVLDKFNGEKSVVFAMKAAELVIDEAVVHTEAISSELKEGEEFNIFEKIPAEIERVERIGFSEAVPMTMVMNVNGVDVNELNTVIELKGTVTLPPFLELESETEGVTVAGNGVLELDVKYNPSFGQPLKLELLCGGMDFTRINDAAGLLPVDSHIKYDGAIEVNGKAVINGARFSSTLLDSDISFGVKFVVGEIAVKTFHGIYSAAIEKIEEKLDLDLGEELEFLREDGNSVTLADPQLEFVLTNPVGIPVDIALHLFGNDENGALIPESEISTTLSILPAKYNETTEELTPVETKLFITTDTSRIKKSGFTNVEIPNLANLLKKIPYSVSLDVEPVVRTTDDVTHHVDIEQPIKLDGAYSVVVPLKFNDLHLCYNDTITDLDSSLGETVDMFSNVSVGVKMDIVNTIPLGLSLKAVPLDADGKVMDDIEIDELKIAAGNGETLLDANGALNADLPVQSFNFAIKSKSGDISSLDGLAFSLEAASDHTTGAAIKGEQGIKISNIVFEVSGDIEADLKDLGL